MINVKNFRFIVIFFTSFLSVFYLNNINAALIDNRYLPLYRQKFTRYPDKLSAVGTNALVMISDGARASDCKEIGLPELNGKYDFIMVSKALELVGKDNPLAPKWRAFHKLDLNLEGKLESQGLWLGYEQWLFNNLSAGISSYFLHVVSRQKFLLTEEIRRDLKFEAGGEIQFDEEVRKANDLLGLRTEQFDKSGFSDIDLYLRYGITKDYFYKFKKIDTGLTLGFLLPAGPKIDINNPASIPFGGDGHWGIYGMGDLTLELKEDLTVGIWLELCKRFSKVQCKRMPVNDEPLAFGAVVGDARIDPGITFAFSPFVALGDIRDGFGVKARYTYTMHESDKWEDLRKDQTVKTKLFNVIQNSKWVAEYITFSLMYDFSKTPKCRGFAPMVYLDWDMPINVLGSHGISKTNRISFGFEYDF